MTRRSIAIVFGVVVVAVAAMVAWWWSHPPDPAAELRARHRALDRLERVPRSDLGRGVERWRLISSANDTITGLWKPPAREDDRAWSIVILGGIGTGDRAALLIPDSLPAGVLAIAWPWKGPVEMGRASFVTRLPAMREALLRTPGALASGVEAVRRARPRAPVALLGASLGAAPTVAALTLATPDAVVLIDGAADLPRLLHSEIRREVRGPAGAWIARPAGALGGRLLSSLEPSRHVVPRGVPVLLVEAEREDRYPPESVARWRALFPDATVWSHPGGHLRPRHREVIAAIVARVSRWIDELPAISGSRVSARPSTPRAFPEERTAPHASRARPTG